MAIINQQARHHGGTMGASITLTFHSEAQCLTNVNYVLIISGIRLNQGI